MNLAYAASQSSEHSAENIGDVILHHVKDTNILSIRIGETDFSIFSKHVLMMWIAAALVVFVFRFAFRKQHVIPHRSLIFEVHFQELEVYFVKNKGLPRLFLTQCGQMTI